MWLFDFYLWKWACAKETPVLMVAASSVLTGFLKGRSELTALKLLKSWTPTSRAAASRMASTSSTLMSSENICDIFLKIICVDVNWQCGQDQILPAHGVNKACEELCAPSFKQSLFTMNFGLLQPREGAKHVADHPTRGRERECVLAVSLRKCDLTETQRWSEQRAKWLIQTKMPESWMTPWGALKSFLLHWRLTPLICRIQKKRMYTPLLFIIDEYKNNSLFKNPTQARTD